MKEKVSISLLLALVALTANAQGFQKSIELYAGPGLDKFTTYSFGASFNGGFQFGDIFYAGMGAGFRQTRVLYYQSYEYHKVLGVGYSDSYDSYDSKYLIPIYLRAKYYLSQTHVKPSLSFDLGYTLDVGQNKNKNTEGLFFEPALGFSFPLGESSIKFAIGYNIQNAHYEFYDLSDSSRETIFGRAGTISFHFECIL